jgi:hypothetical protein
MTKEKALEKWAPEFQTRDIEGNGAADIAAREAENQLFNAHFAEGCE